MLLPQDRPAVPAAACMHGIAAVLSRWAPAGGPPLPACSSPAPSTVPTGPWAWTLMRTCPRGPTRRRFKSGADFPHAPESVRGGLAALPNQPTQPLPGYACMGGGAGCSHPQVHLPAVPAAWLLEPSRLSMLSSFADQAPCVAVTTDLRPGRRFREQGKCSICSARLMLRGQFRSRLQCRQLA